MNQKMLDKGVKKLKLETIKMKKENVKFIQSQKGSRKFKMEGMS